MVSGWNCRAKFWLRASGNRGLYQKIGNPRKVGKYPYFANQLRFLLYSLARPFITGVFMHKSGPKVGSNDDAIWRFDSYSLLAANYSVESLSSVNLTVQKHHQVWKPVWRSYKERKKWGNEGETETDWSRQSAGQCSRHTHTHTHTHTLDLGPETGTLQHV